MKSNGVKVKSIINYLATIFTWAIFVILITIAALLIYYYVSVQIYARKGSDYAPPFSIYTIVSPSMEDTILVYDVIINTKIKKPTDIKVGDVITFKSTSSLSWGMNITHRVKDIQIVNGKYEFKTQGDNNAFPDTAPALYENVIGKTVIRLPQLGKLQMFVGSKFGWLTVVILPAFYVIIKDVAKLIRISKLKKTASGENELMKKEVENSDVRVIDADSVDKK